MQTEPKRNLMNKLSKALVLTSLMTCLSTSVLAGPNTVDLDALVAPASTNSFAPAAGISVEQATTIARRHTRGRVLSTTPKRMANGMAYKVRMLVDGERVVTLLVGPKGRVRK